MTYGIDHAHQGEPGLWCDEIGRVARLSAREMEVFLLLGSGYSNRSAAGRLDVSERTIKAHVARILEKLEVESRLQAGLVAQAYQLLNGILPGLAEAR